MTKLEVEIHDNVISVLHKLKNINDSGIELIVPEGSVLFENILNLKLIKNWSEKENYVISFQTNDPEGQRMLAAMENGDKEIESAEKEIETSDEKTVSPKAGLPKLKLSLPSIKLKKGRIIGLIILILALLGILGFAAYQYLSSKPVANIKIVVDSQPLTRSLEIKVKSGEETNAEEKILRGYTVEANVDDEVSVETTGEKVVGERAEGRVVIYNKTEEEKEFDDGTELIYEDDDDEEFIYFLKDDVTIEPGVETSDSTFIYGSAEVDVVAEDIGSKYNLDEDEDLEVEDESTSDFEAEVVEDIDGGSRDTVQIVSQEDLDTAAAKLKQNAEETAYRALDDKITGGQKLISGSESIAVIKEEYSHKLEDETEELTLSQTFSAKGLVYDPDELNDLIDQLIQEFVPEDFVLSTKERSVSVEILGNTETTTLNESEADLQVTIRTFVVTDISEDSIKNDLMGKKVPDAQRYIGSIKDVQSYEFNLEPHFPLFDYVPNDKSRIIINLERE